MKTLEQRVGQLLMAGFDGYEAPDYVLQWLREGRLGGVILFKRNVQNPQQLAALTKALHEAASSPLLIAIDQEGGTVARLRDGFAESPGAMALASIANARSATPTVKSVCGVLADELRALGINWTYAPMVDLAYNKDNPSVGTRSFGTDVQRVASLAKATVDGFQSNGVAACAKHFPGLGHTALDTHLALPVLDTPLDDLIAVDLLPYQEALTKDLASIMTTHTIYSVLDSAHPATLSDNVIQTLIREKLGFEGVVTTDCMEMKAIDDHYGVRESTVRAVKAGVDLVLFSHTREKQAVAYDSLLEAVKSGLISEDTINAANARIAALKERFPAKVAEDLSSINSEDNQSTMLTAAEKTITLLNPQEGLLPLKPDDNRTVLLVEFPARTESGIQGEGHETQLSGYLKARLPNLETVVLSPTADLDSIEAQANESDLLLIASRSAHLSEEHTATLQRLGKTSVPLVLLALRNPYDAALLDDVPVLCTAGDSTPSLQALTNALMGDFEPSGELPVEL